MRFPYHGGVDTVKVDQTVRFAAGLSLQAETAPAVAQAADVVRMGLMGRAPDLAVVFFSSHHAEHAPEVLRTVRRELGPRTILGVSGEGVIGGRVEVERAPGVSILAACLPGTELKPFTADDFPALKAGVENEHDKLAAAIGADQDLRATLLFVDPFTLPTVNLVPALNECRARLPDGSRAGLLLGGMASSGRGPGGNALLLNDRVVRQGAVGISIRNLPGVRGVRVDSLVSQGCVGFGPSMIVTRAKGNVITQLSGRPALEVIQEVIGELPEERREKLKTGLFLGRVINEYKDRFGRGDFLIRAVIGVDQSNGAVAVNDLVRIGQTVRLHMRDALTASDDLGLMLDAQRLHAPPAGALLITCNGRGTRLFSTHSHDAAKVSQAFAPGLGGPELAKGGEIIEAPGLPGVGLAAGERHVPLAGFFAAGEIGPVGGDSFVHGHTACVAFFRPEA